MTSPTCTGGWPGDRQGGREEDRRTRDRRPCLRWSWDCDAGKVSSCLFGWLELNDEYHCHILNVSNKFGETSIVFFFFQIGRF